MFGAKYKAETEVRIKAMEDELMDLRSVAAQLIRWKDACSGNMAEQVKSVNKLEQKCDFLADKIEANFDAQDTVNVEIRKDLAWLKELQCSTYEGAMERLKAMVAFESKRKLELENPTIVNMG